MKYKRRDFLKLSGAGLALTPGALLDASEKLQVAGGDHRLVVVQLSGGKDGRCNLGKFIVDRTRRIVGYLR